MSYDPKWIRDDAVVKRDGTNDLTGDWDIGNQRAISLEELQIRDASGLTISDTTANVLVSIDNQTGLFSLRHGSGVNEISSNSTLIENSDNVIPTQKAIKTYVDGIAGTSGTSGTSGATGTSGSSGTTAIGGAFTHVQSSDSTSWVITHMLNSQYVNVEVVDSNDLAIIPDEISFDTTNQLTITFLTDESGHAAITSGGGQSGTSGTSGTTGTSGSSGTSGTGATLSVPQEWTGQQNFNEAAITSTSNAVAWNLDTGQCAVHTMTENTTISAPSNINAGATYMLRVVQAAGVYTLAFNAVFEWGDAAAPTAPAANGDVIILSFYSDGTTMYGVECIRVEA